VKGGKPVSTGVEGLDRILGGYPLGKAILITGNAGCGKTILALHFIRFQCLEGKRCTYMMIDGAKESLFRQASGFGWDLESFEERGLLKVISVGGEGTSGRGYQLGVSDTSAGFFSLVEMIDPEVDSVVIDDISLIAIGMTLSQFRRQLNFLIHSLRKRGCTALLVANETLLRGKIEVTLHAVEGAIRLMKRDNPFTGTRERVLEIVKMRCAPAPIDRLTFDIMGNGLEIHS